MILRLLIGSWRFTFTMAPITKVTGVNSNLPNGDHILMWDFDEIPLIVVETALGLMQDIYELPNIYILNTGTQDHFIAYCFESLCWKEVVEILAATPYLDDNFFKYGVYRDHFTLRVTPKEGRKPKLVHTLKSIRPETASIDELSSWTKGYPHANKGYTFLSPRMCSDSSNSEGTHSTHLS